MEKTYSVRWQGGDVGKVYVSKIGLYYKIQCLCNLQGQWLELCCQGENGEENLGLLVPEGNEMKLEKQIPQKRLGTGKMHFFLHSRMGKNNVPVPVIPDKEFAFLQQLEEGYLIWQEGRPMVAFQKNKEKR